MKKLYTIEEIRDTIKGVVGRRIVEVTVQVIELQGKEKYKKYTIDLGYPAYGDKHYSASIEYLDKMKDQKLDHTSATEISNQIRGLWYEKHN